MVRLMPKSAHLLTEDGGGGNRWVAGCAMPCLPDVNRLPSTLVQYR